jgi:hypothetical protein
MAIEGEGPGVNASRQTIGLSPGVDPDRSKICTEAWLKEGPVGMREGLASTVESLQPA